MTSWRATTSQRAQDDFDDLLNATLPFAREQIRRRGTFVPFGAVVGQDGEVGLTGAAGDDSLETIELLYRGAQHDAQVIRAVAFLADVRTAFGDAIRFEVEHVEGRALEIVIPYRRGKVRRSVQFADMIVSPATMRVWTTR